MLFVQRDGRSSTTEPVLQDDGRKLGRASSMDLSRLSSDFYLIFFGKTFNIPLAPATVHSCLIIVDFSALFAIFAISRALPFLL